MSNKLKKNEEDKRVFGVCSGLGEFFGIETWMIRAGFVIGLLLGFSTLPIYIVLAIFMPRD